MKNGKLTTQKLHGMIRKGLGLKSSKYSPSQIIDRQTYSLHTSIKGVFGILAPGHLSKIAKILTANGILYDASQLYRGFIVIPVHQVVVKALRLNV